VTVRFRVLRQDRGATAIEYAIIGALIGIGLVGSLLGTKGSLNQVFGTASQGVNLMQDMAHFKSYKTI
jgi:Flp pilus assembly pilin Flp